MRDLVRVREAQPGRTRFERGMGLSKSHDHSSLKTAPTALAFSSGNKHNETTPQISLLDTVTPYQAHALIEFG